MRKQQVRTPQHDRARILVVDDKAENIHTIMNILQDRYAITAATSGEQAIQMACRSPRPDLILLDIRMPDMDGYEVLQTLKSDPLTRDIPVILVTALTDAVDEAHGLSLGAADYITKPVNPDLLRVRVMAQLELQRHRRVSEVLAGEQEQKDSTILIVDDVSDNVHELVNALSGEFRIRVATSGKDALAIVEGGNPPDLILLDILMPEMDGHETLRRIKMTEAGERIPVIFVTVVDKTVDKLRGFSLGAADYVTKPYDIDEIRARIKTHLRISHLQSAYEKAYNSLRELEEMRDNLVHMIVHDMRSLLMAICASLEMVLLEQEPSLSTNQQQMLKTACSAGRELQTMITSLLDVSQIEAGNMPLACQSCCLEDIVEEVVEKVTPLARERTIYIAPSSEKIPARCDPDVTGRIITNLLINAIKFSPNPSRITIVISRQKQWARVDVVDQGPGIPLDFQKKIFDKFARIEWQAKGKKFSCGLGLTFCKMAAEAQDGYIRLKSREGKGSIFSLYLPLAETM